MLPLLIITPRTLVASGLHLVLLFYVYLCNFCPTNSHFTPLSFPTLGGGGKLGCRSSFLSLFFFPRPIGTDSRYRPDFTGFPAWDLRSSGEIQQRRGPRGPRGRQPVRCPRGVKIFQGVWLRFIGTPRLLLYGYGYYTVGAPGWLCYFKVFTF